MPARRLLRIFDDLYGAAFLFAPGLLVNLRLGSAAMFPKPRDFAACACTGPVFRIVVAPDFAVQPEDRITGVLAHEFGHALLMFAGHRGHSEQEADDMAERAFGRRIRYDEDDVQTVGVGAYPRPPHLPR